MNDFQKRWMNSTNASSAICVSSTAWMGKKLSTSLVFISVSSIMSYLYALCLAATPMTTSNTPGR
jgi:hypothetical protein